MKKILIVILSIIAVLSFSFGLIACNDNGNDTNQNLEQNQEQGETQGQGETLSQGEAQGQDESQGQGESKTEASEFVVLDGDGNVVETSDATYFIDEDVDAVVILGDGYTLSGKSEYPIFVESEEVAFMTWKNLEIDSEIGFGFSVWNTYGLIIKLEGENNITVNGYSEYLKTNKQTYGNIGIDMGADLTFVGDGNLNITCGKVRTDLTDKKAFNCGIYSCTGDADLSIATSGKINIVIERAEGTATTNVLQTGILCDLSTFRMVNGEVDIDIKSSIASHGEVNVYGVFGILSFDGGKISINVEKRSAYESGEALALYITNNQSSVDFAVENAESIETDIGYKFAQKTAGEKVVVSFSSEEDGVADGETPSDRHGIVVPGPVRIVPVRDELRIKLDPPAIIGMQEDGEFVSDIVKAIKEKLCYVALDPEENGEEGTMPELQVIVFASEGTDKYADGHRRLPVIVPPVLPKGNSIDGLDELLRRTKIDVLVISGLDKGEWSVVGSKAEDGETVSNIVKAIKEKLCYVAIDPEENGEKSTDPKSPLWALLYHDGTDLHVVTMSGGGYVITSADGETPTDATGRIIISQLKTGDDPSWVALNSSATIIITPIISRKNGETATDAIHAPIFIPKSVEENGTPTEWGEGDVIYLIPLVGGLFSTTITDEEGNVNSLQPRIVLIGKPWYVATAGETDGECFAIVIAPSGFPDSVEADGEGAISIIGGGEGGEEQGEAGIKEEVIYIGIIEHVESAESVPMQRAVIMSLDDLRPVTVAYNNGYSTDIVANQARAVAGGLYLDAIEDRIVEIRGVDTRIVGNMAGEASDGVENGNFVIALGGLAFEYVGGHLYGVAATPTLVNPKWMESDGEVTDAIIGWSASANIIGGSVGRFFRVIVTDSDSEVTDGVDGEGEQWTVSNEGGTIIIVVPQGASGFFFNSALIESNGESVITGSGFSGNESSQSGGAIYLIGANGEIYVPWRTYTDDQDAVHFYHLEIRTENYGEGAIAIIGGEGEEDQGEEPTEPEEVPTFMESRIVTVIGARNINEANKVPTPPKPHPGPMPYVHDPSDAVWDIWILDTIKGAVPFRLPLLKEGDPSQADGEENAKFGGDVTIIIMRDGASTNWAKPAMRYVLLVGETPTKTDGEEGEISTAVDFGGDTTIVIVPISPIRVR